ncbi:MAG: hypothetical protein LBQ41_00950 [Candidatus Ancillula sp.]|jgi:glutamate--cysteine ligase|nr:hypothetical protein [Candidatus Ancillula sp.]
MNIKDLKSYILSGVTPPSEYQFGLELEHFVVDRDGKAVPYKNGVETLLSKMAQAAGVSVDVVKEDGNILGLNLPKLAISLEPGSQFEASIGPCKTVEEISTIYTHFETLLRPILDANGWNLETYGYRLRESPEDIKLIPKQRYFEMDGYLSQTGEFGVDMMRCSAATQVSIDFSSEADAISKLRLASILSPVFAYIFSNTPVVRKSKNDDPLFRAKMWYKIDEKRAGVIPGIFDEDYSVEDYCRWVFNTPVMTRNYAGSKMDDVEFTLSTVFPDVRMKKFVELRSVDSIPISRALEYVTLVGNVFYDNQKLHALLDYFEWQSLTERDVYGAADVLSQNSVGNMQLYGKDYDEILEKIYE